MTTTKTVTFTLMHFSIAFGVTYAITGNAALGGLVAAIEPLVNSVGYYFHEKIWKQIEAPLQARVQRWRQHWQGA